MSNIFVRSTDGNDADNGSTWALAKATLAGAAAIDAAGDTIFVSQAHAESSGTAQVIALAGTISSPVKVLCGNDGAEPPTALATAATLTNTSGGFEFTGYGYIYGLIFISGGGFLVNKSVADGTMVLDQCSLQTTGGLIGIGAIFINAPTKTILKDTTLKLHSTSSRVSCNGEVQIRGGSLVSGTTTPSALFDGGGDRTHSKVLCEGFDFSNAAATINLVATNSNGSCAFTFRNCKLPAAWSGALVSGTLYSGQRYEMYNCDSGSTNYRLWVEDYCGTVKHETTLVRTGGASDSTTPLAWKMASSANAKYPLLPLVSPEIVVWNDTAGSAKTVTIDILHDSVTNLKDDEVWLEVQYLGTSGVPLGSFVSDAKADVLATAADQTASSATWTTTGMSNPNKQKLSVTFTPQQAGYLHAVVRLAKASYSVYIDPLLQVS